MAAIKISVFDEEPLVREALGRLLPGFGVEVISEYSQPGAFLVGLLRDAPRVTLVDCFQAADPMGFLLSIRERHPQLPIAVFTAARRAGPPEKCIEAGAAAFLDKSLLDAQGLASAILQVAEGKRLCPFEAFNVGTRSESRGEEPEVVRLLSPREREVLAHVAVGEDNLKIAACLGISERTVKAHVCNLYRKLGQENRTQMALFARQLGMRPAALTSTLELSGAPDGSRQELPS